MFVQIVMLTADQTMYNLRVAPGRYKIRLTGLQYYPTVPARGEVVEFESIIFRQLYGTQKYLTICDDLLVSVFDKTGFWEADINGPISIGVNHVAPPLAPGDVLNFGRCVLNLDMELVN